MSKYEAKKLPKKFKGNWQCSYCNENIREIEGNMYRQCGCGEWRNDPLLGWQYIPRGAEHSEYKEDKQL